MFLVFLPSSNSFPLHDSFSSFLASCLIMCCFEGVRQTGDMKLYSTVKYLFLDLLSTPGQLDLWQKVVHVSDHTSLLSNTEGRH